MENVYKLLEFIGSVEDIRYTLYAEDGEIIEPVRERIESDEVMKEKHIPFLKEHKTELVILGDPGDVSWCGICLDGKCHVLGPIKEETIPSNIFRQYCCMFYYALTNEKIEIEKMLFESDVFSETLNQDPDETEANLRNCWQCEQEMYDVVKYGMRVDAKKLISRYGKIVLRKIYPDDMTRNYKDLALMLLSLTVHASIEGGLPLATAYTLQAYYTSKIERVRNGAEIAAINIELFEDFIYRVRNLKLRQEKESRFLIEVEDYIRLHLEEEINLKMLAKQFNYTEYYLSRKFKEESGIRISEFLGKERMKRAIFLLKTTDESVSSISERLRYSSLSYFISEFRKMYGVSPAEMRKAQGPSE